MKKLLLVTFTSLLTLQSQAGLVGDFTHTHNYPGYIDLEPQSTAYRGPGIRNVDYGDGVITQTPSALLATYFSGNKISLDMLRSVIAEIKVMQENARIAFCQSEQAEDDLSQEGCNDGFPVGKLGHKWEKKSVNVAYKYSIELFEEAISLAPFITKENINSRGAMPFLEAFFDGFEVYQGVVSESSQMGKYSGVEQNARMFLETIRPTAITRGRSESANLMRTSTADEGTFYSPEELEELKTKGHDISRLNPPDSGFWKNPRKSIRVFNTENYDGGELPYFRKELSLHEIEDLMSPAIPIDVVYDLAPPKGTGETPKFIVKYGNSTLKMKFSTDRMGRRESLSLFDEALKIVRGTEVNTETVVNNLAAALGFAVEGTYHKDTVRVFLTDKVYERGTFDEDFKRLVQMMDERYQASENVTSALRNVKIDPVSGRKYFELRNVQLERKSGSNTDLNIGFFVRKGLGKSLKREHRGFALFLAWIWDVDTKDINDALKLVPYQSADGKLKYKIVMSNSDMGSTLGSNRPNFYNFKLIKEAIKDANGNPEYIRLNYLRIYPNDLMDAITFDDAKWMARLIGQLTEEQIVNAFLGAGYSEVIARYYTGLMLKKRNDLLDALGLIGEEFTRAPEFTGTLPGHEQFFQNGKLTDPQNQLWDRSREPFPPFWGAGLQNIEGEPQEYFIKLSKIKLLSMAGDIVYNSLVARMGVSTEGLKFNEIIVPDKDQVKGCNRACFFQGTNAGLEGFIPWRFIIANPDRESKAPFLIVDIFRLGFFLGGTAQGAFGVNIPGAPGLGLGGNHYQISEFIKVRPVKELGDLFSKKSDLFTMPKLSFRGARMKVINELKENEYLIQTHYIGLRAKAKANFNTGWALPITPSVNFRGDILRASRVTYMGKEEKKLLVGWDQLKDATANLRFYALDYVLKLIETEHKKLRTVQRTFEFDRGREEDQEVLRSHVNQIVPNEIPEQYFMARRTTNVTERRFSWGLLVFFKKTSLRRKISVDYEEPLINYRTSSSSYVRDITRTRMTRRLGMSVSNYKIQSSLNGQNEVFAKVRLFGVFENMTKFKFKAFLEHYTPLLPDNFIQFDPEAVRENFGTLEMNLETIFPERALKNVFGQSISKQGLCLVYARVHQHDWNQEDCDHLARVKNRFLSGLPAIKRRFLKLWKKYEKVRVSFWELIGDRQNHKNNLRDLTDILTDNGDYDYRVMNLFIALSQRSHFYRRASMNSSLEAFPGQTGTVREDRNAQGDYRPPTSMRADNPEEEFKMFTDVLHKTIQKMFYNNQYAYDSSSF